MKKNSKIIIFFIFLILLAIFLTCFAGTFIRLLYPLKYKEYIFENAKENDLDPYLIMAVIKAESGFNAKAHSGKARGLMQITDSTAVWIAEKLQIEFEADDIENPELNIKMGCYYLGYLSDLYEDEVVLAAYNAGMGKVAAWLKDSSLSSDGKKLDYIPYNETREYVLKVQKYERIYQYLYR